MYMRKGREMTVERIEELHKEFIKAVKHIPVDKLDKYWDDLRELICYAKEKAKEEETLKQHIKVLQVESLGDFIDIRETPKCKNSAEDTLRESQIYVAGMMDASDVIWKHLDRCLDSIRNQNGEQLN